MKEAIKRIILSLIFTVLFSPVYILFIYIFSIFFKNIPYMLNRFFLVLSVIIYCSLIYFRTSSIVKEKNGLWGRVKKLLKPNVKKIILFSVLLILLIVFSFLKSPLLFIIFPASIFLFFAEFFLIPDGDSSGPWYLSIISILMFLFSNYFLSCLIAAIWDKIVGYLKKRKQEQL